MKRVALTGGIATGKSWVLRRFASLGVPTIDADVVAREVVAPGTAAAARILSRFGRAVMDDDGALDRKALAAIVFADAGARADLEAIVHPAVYEAIRAWFAALPADTPLALADIPLLYETGHADEFDAVVVTACSPEEQVRRLVARDGVDETGARRRLAAQWPIEEKVRRADYVIHTDGTHAETDAQVDAVLARLSV
jgi:dephospho-CoA kinase